MAHSALTHDWLMGCGQLLRPLYDRLVRVTLQSAALHTDERTSAAVPSPGLPGDPTVPSPNADA